MPLNNTWLSSGPTWPQIIVDAGSAFTFGNNAFGFFPVVNGMAPSEYGTISAVYYNDVPGVAKFSRGALTGGLPDTGVIQWANGTKSAEFVVMKNGAEFARLVFSFA